MKKYLYKTAIVAIIFIAFGITSCSDFLEEDNKTGSTADLEYATQSGIDGLVGSCYSFLRLWGGQAAGIAYGDSGTDMFYYGKDCGLKPLGNYSFTSETDETTVFDQYWEAFYCAVDVCNTALVYVPQNGVISNDKKNSYLGEVHFLRAYYYFLMVNIWGPIPYNSEPIKSLSSEAFRVPEEEVYSKILEDIDKAQGYLSLNDNDKNTMRVSTVACKAFRSRVLLYAASWIGERGITSSSAYVGKNLYELAQKNAEEVISSGFASFYDNTSDLWFMDNEDLNKNKEAIFGIHYSKDVTTKSQCAPIRYSTGAAYSKQMARGGTSKGGSMAHLPFVGLWNNSGSDLSDVFTRPTKIGTEVQGVVINDYYSRYSRGFRNYLPTLYTLNLFTQYKNTDQRYEASLRDHYDIAPGIVSNKYSLMKDTAIYFINVDANTPEGTAAIERGRDRYRVYTRTGGDLPLYTSNNPATALPTFGIQTPISAIYKDNRYNTEQMSGENVFVAVKKFEENSPGYSTNALITPDISERDIMLIRLAEMYLIKAECQLKLNNNSGALATINELREKRAIPGKNNSISGPVDINTILDERCLEFLGEQNRWFDLKRTRTLLERVEKYNAQASAGIKPIHYYRPIPMTQMQAVSNLSAVPGEGFWQNEGF